jgi:DNA-binding Xre family transcriptional regulator
MENYNQAAKTGFQMEIQFLKERMKVKKISLKKLSELTEVSTSTLTRNFNRETEMLHITFLKICGALEVQPWLVPREVSKDESFKRIYFN